MMKRPSLLAAFIFLGLTLVSAAVVRRGEARLGLGKSEVTQFNEAVLNAASPIPSPFSLPRTEPSSQTFTVDGVQRTALIYPSAASVPKTGAPIVFVFHGHGGRAQAAAQRFHIDKLWPEAIVVYLQGLPGVEGITDPEGRKSGWQKTPGQLGDRDVKFVDAVLARIQKDYKTDPNRVYALGHSNGGRFVNVLWNMRGDKFAAFCSASGQGGRLIEGAIPKPIFIIAGEKDPIVPFQAQAYSIDLARKLLKTDQSTAKVEGYVRMERGISNTELATYIHPGGHEFPQEALPLVVSFFQRHTKQ